MVKSIKQILSLLSAAILAATTTDITPISNAAASADASSYIADAHDHDHDDCCECDDNTGEGITIALLDAGVSEYKTADRISFIDDATVDSDHGNKMMNSLVNIVPGASVLDVRVLDDEGKGTYSSVEKGIRWSVDHSADIIVMSFVGENRSAMLENALEFAEENNVLVVAAAGNYSSENAVYPAAYPTVLSVGAIDENGDIQSFSNYGKYVDTYAQSADGTSSAAQLIAASAAVMLEDNPDMSVSDIRAYYNSVKSAELEPAEEDNADTVVYAAATCKTHSYSFYMTAKAATCTTSGVAIYKCSKCGTTQNRTISAYGHSWGSWTTTKSATCTAAAVQTRKCSRYGCGMTEKRNSGSALGHSYNWVTTKAATCTATGVSSYKCSRSGCGYVSQTKPIAALGHNYKLKQVAKAATCTTAGSEIDQCSRCSGTRTRTVNAYGHNWGSWTTTKSATCTAAAVQTRKCSRSGCGMTEKRNSGSALGHSYSWVTTKAATCTATGVSSYKCSRSGCGYVSQTKTIAALGHDYKLKQVAKAVTCTTDGAEIDQCSRCSSTRTRTVKALDHSYSWVTTKAATCTATGVSSYKCSRSGCGYVSQTKPIAALGHNYKLKQVAKTVTCTSDGAEIDQCSRCTATRTRTVKALGHNMGSWTTVTQASKTSPGKKTRKCSRCTYKEDEILPQLGELKVDDYSTSTFYFHADGSLEKSLHSWPLVYTDSNGKTYMQLSFTSNVDWSVSSTGNYVNFMNANLQKISSGKSGKNTLIICLGAMPLTYNDENRKCTITLKANDVTKKYTLSQCNYIINGINKKTYINTGEIPDLISEAGSSSSAAKALRCEYGSMAINVYDFRNFRKLAVSTRKIDSSHFVVEYALFMANVTKKNDELWAEIELLENHGIKLTQNGTLFTTTATIGSSFADVRDEIYEDKVNKANLGVTLANDALTLFCSYKLPIANKLASFAVGKCRGKLATGLGELIVSSIYKSNSNTTVSTSSSVSIKGGCSFTYNTDEVNIYAYGNPSDIATAKSTISINIVDTAGRSCSKTYTYY